MFLAVSAKVARGLLINLDINPLLFAYGIIPYLVASIFIVAL
nr:MAG TPA: hypothetical protein [Bacteriophage sp.]